MFPDRFAGLAHARAFMTDFVAWYNEALYRAKTRRTWCELLFRDSGAGW